MLRPVDMQVIVPRSLDIQKIQSVDQNRPNWDQQNFAKEMMVQSQLQQGQIQKSSSSGEGNRVGQDSPEKEKKRSLKYNRFQNQRKKQEQEELEKLLDTERGQHIDFKV